MSQTVLITGAAGKTGRAVTKALAPRPVQIRALVHRPDQQARARAAGADEVIVGDLRDRSTLRRAVAGTRAIYFIAPNVHPEEVSIGRIAIDVACNANVEHFVYHSVLRPQIEAMPHHWRKMRVEEMLSESGVATTILQPAPYMQNLLAAWPRILSNGVLATPYPATTRTALVDLDDVAQVAATVLTEPGHAGATYELCGPDAPNQHEIAAVLENRLGRPVRTETIGRDTWAHEARQAGLDDDRVATLLAMFRYYEQHGLPGNANVLTWLLGRSPTSLASFVEHVHQGT